MTKAHKAKHALYAAVVILVVWGFYLLTSDVTPTMLTYLVSVIPLAMIVITAFARANDISTSLSGLRWHVRRAGLVLAGAGAFALLLAPWIHGLMPSWNDVMLEVGVAMTWFTTPGMPPWWRYISGVDDVSGS